MANTRQVNFINEQPITLTSKPIIKSELNHAPIGKRAGHLPELRRVDILISHYESRMVENIPCLHAELERMVLGDMRQLLDSGVHIESPRPGEHAPLQRPDIAGRRIEENL